WEEYGIRVVDVMPPFVSSPMLQEQQQSAPVIDKLGVNLYPEDVADVVLQQIEKPRTHRAVSLQFKLGWALSQILPRAVLGKLLRVLSRYPGSLLSHPALSGRPWTLHQLAEAGVFTATQPRQRIQCRGVHLQARFRSGNIIIQPDLLQ